MQAIYKIINTINGKIYIGSTNNINRRWNNHRCKLRNGKHENSYLQSAWDKYGENSFEFSVVEEVSDSNRIQREIYYLNETRSYERDIGYNFDKLPNDKSGKNNPFYGKKHTQETIEKIIKNANNRSDDLKRKMGEKNKGEGSGVAKLTFEQVVEIRKLYVKNIVTYKMLSEKFNVGKSTIQAIIEGRSWK